MGVIDDLGTVESRLAQLSPGSHQWIAVASPTAASVLARLGQLELDALVVNGLERSAICAVRAIRTASTVGILYAHDSEQVERVCDVLIAGASGHINVQAGLSEWVAALVAVSSGGYSVGTTVFSALLNRLRAIDERTVIGSRLQVALTPHEQRVLDLLVEGYSYKGVAEILGISINTVAYHVRHTYRKLRVHSKAQAVARALGKS